MSIVVTKAQDEIEVLRSLIDCILFVRWGVVDNDAQIGSASTVVESVDVVTSVNLITVRLTDGKAHA